ncbi:MAG: ATP-binding protein [Geminicoccaceae bacterium]
MKTSSQQGHALSRRYSLIAAVGVIPLILIILLLAWFQYRSQHDQIVENLEGEVVKHGTLFGNVIETVRDHVRSMGAWAKIYYEDPSLSAEAALESPTTIVDRAAQQAVDPLQDWRPTDSRVFHRTLALDQAELGLAEGLVQHMRLAHRAMPYLRWSYYFAADESFLSFYPFGQSEALGGTLRAKSNETVVETMFSQPIMTREDGQAATDALPSTYWTPAFLDPAGAGWIVAHATEVSLDGERKGVVGTAVLLDFLTGFVRAFDYPCGKIWLMNDQGQILAASDGRRVSGLRLLTHEDVLPGALGDLDVQALTAPSRHFKTFDGYNVLSRPIAATPWHLLYIIEPGEVTALILPRFIPYGVILIGLLLTFFLAQLLRRRLVIGPALKLVDYIKAESQEQPKPPPELPAMWRPWVAAVSDAFAAKREVNQRILESEANFRTMAEAHPVPVAIIELANGCVLHASQAFADFFRVPLDDLIGSNIQRLYVDPEDRAKYVQKLREEGGVQNFEIWMKRGDSSIFPTSASARMIEFRGVDAAIVGGVDLTEKKATDAKIEQQREALERSEQRFRTIAEGHPVPLAIVRRSDQKLLYASEPFAELLNLPLSDLYKTDLRDFYAEPEDRHRLSEILNVSQRADNIEVAIKRPDGTAFPAAVTCKLMDYEGAVAYVSSFVDLTEKKYAEAEIARQREALHQAEKLNALGSLLANVAHELNNPLSVVVGYATMQLDFSTDPKSRERAEKIHAAAERCARIVKTFLAMARQKQDVRGPVQINQVIKSALEIAGYGLRTADIELQMQLDPDSPDLLGDADQLTLVFMNLIVNAQHALEDREGTKLLKISTGRDQKTVWVEFADNGPGIAGEIVQRIFDPFFTTKPQGVGTGIGLSVCHSIVSAHDGEITVASNLEGGALFKVSLPIMEAAALEENGWLEAKARPRLSGRILVVEDEPEIAEMVAEMLAQDGHEVSIAISGRAALERIDRETPDLIVSDVRMPGLGGPDLHRILSERNPEIARRILFVTGDTLAYGLGDFFARTGARLLEKPLDPEVLCLEVQELLASFGQPPDEEELRAKRTGA